MKTNPLRAAKRRQQVAEARLATAKAQVEAKALEHTRQLIESPTPVPVPWKEYPAFDEFSRLPGDRPYVWTDIRDRTEGRYLPVYETEYDLRRLRAKARNLRALFPVAEAALESLTNYVIGSGFALEVQPDTPGAAELASKVQGVLDRFVDYNQFTGYLDREIHEESRTDGEAFVGLYRDGNEVRAEILSPDFILEPGQPAPLEQMLGCGHKLNHWWHGVHTQWNPKLKRDDVCRPLGYHAVFTNEGDQWDYLPASRLEHIKLNVTREGRRGVSDFYLVEKDLEHEGKIRHNTALGAAILAAIVMIRRHASGVSKSSIESMVQGNATYDYTQQTSSGGATRYGENTKPGTVKDIPNGMEPMLGPLGTLRSPIYIEVAQYLLRIIGARWNMPEYIISGDASNANYSSTLVAANSFVKSREADQQRYRLHFERIAWKAMAMYHEAGEFGGVTMQQLRRMVSITAKPPSVASKDELQSAQVNAILNQNGVMSKRTWAGSTGLDYDEERMEMRSEPQPVTQGILATEQRIRDLTFSLLESDGKH